MILNWPTYVLSASLVCHKISNKGSYHQRPVALIANIFTEIWCCHVFFIATFLVKLPTKNGKILFMLLLAKSLKKTLWSTQIHLYAKNIVDSWLCTIHDLKIPYMLGLKLSWFLQPLTLFAATNKYLSLTCYCFLS